MPSPSFSPEHEIPFSFCVQKFPPPLRSFRPKLLPNQKLLSNPFLCLLIYTHTPYLRTFFIKRPYPFNCFSSVKTTLPVCFRKCSFKCCFFPYSRSQPGNSQRYLEISKVFGPRLNSRVNLIFEPSKSSISSLFPFLWALFTCSLSNFEVSNLNIWVIIAMHV